MTVSPPSKAPRTPSLPSLAALPVLACVLSCLWAGQVQAARWEDHRTAALRAIDQIDYPKAIEQFEAAIYFARQSQAPDRDIAGLWENLTAAYLADEQYRRVWDALARWERILVANAGQGWVREQQIQRDRMARLLFEETRRARNQSAEAP